MNIPFSFKNRYFPKKFTESASTGGDPNVRCSSVETQTYWYCGILCIFYDLSIYLSIYPPIYLCIYYLSPLSIYLSLYCICYIYYILHITYIYIYIYIYIYEPETSVCMCYTITVKQKTQRLLILSHVCELYIFVICYLVILFYNLDLAMN